MDKTVDIAVSSAWETRRELEKGGQGIPGAGVGGRDAFSLTKETPATTRSAPEKTCGTAEKAVGKYSKGMQTRLGIAVAMLGEPDLLMLDEPTEGLDPVGVVEVRRLLQAQVSEGRTVLLSSHQLPEVEQMCSRVTVLKEGRTVIEGSVEDLAKRLHGGVVYKAEFDSLAPALMDELKTVDGVSEVTSMEEDVVAILMSKDYDVRPTLARLAVKHGSLLLSCEREETSLEELFISLVKENK